MSLRPKFLTVDQVVALHKLQVDEFGGVHGIKNEGLLLSALAQPEAGFGDEYFHKDLFEMASACFREARVGCSSKSRDERADRRILQKQYVEIVIRHA